MKTLPAVSSAVLLSAVLSGLADDAVFQTTVAQWKNDAPGAVVFFYDDGCATAHKNVIPVLLKYHVPGTFYPITKGWDEAAKKQWSASAKHPEVTLGNHTFSHGDVPDTGKLAEEVQKGDAVIREVAGLSKNALLSFAQPGVKVWKVSAEELRAELAKNQEILRHNFIMAKSDDQNGWFIRTAEEGIARVLDVAEKNHSCAAMLCHGVGGDWLSFDADQHEKLIAEAAKRMKENRIWVAPEIAVQKYEAERKASTVSAPEVAGGKASFDLALATGPEYDEPLTLVTTVPPAWTKASVAVGKADAVTVPVKDGKIVYDVPAAAVRVVVAPAP